MEASKYKIGIGDCRFGSSPLITDRSGFGAGAARTNTQRSSLVDPSDRTSTGTDAMYIEHRNTDRHLPFEFVIARYETMSGLDDGSIETGSTNVSMYNVFNFRRARQVRGARDTRAGPNSISSSGPSWHSRCP